MVTPDFYWNRKPVISIIHVDCIFCVAHLIPLFGDSFIPDDVTHVNSLDSFKAFYVNRFVDHHVFDIAS